MAETREAREQSTRDVGKRKEHWKRPELLPDPAPRAGFLPRWVRVSSLGQVDATNVSSKIREGWVPAKAKDHPEIIIVAVEQERFKDNIVIGGLMLCWAPVEMVKERNDYYKNQAASQMSSVDNNLMRESDARMPLFNDRKSSTTFGTGK
jgi:hypothetical protein